MPSKPMKRPLPPHDASLPLEERVFGALLRLPFTSRSLHFETHGTTVVLMGVLPSYYQAQCAGEAVRELEGVTALDNRIAVRAA
jgi:hypothetical protein